MDPKFQTSFIPKKPLIQSPGKPVRTMNFFSLIMSVIFITVLVIAAGVYGYKLYLTNNNTKLQATLDTDLKKFERPIVDELSRLDKRIESSKELINQHVALTSLFDFLSSVTLKSVRFASFKYSVSPQKITINMSGQAQSFSSVALQAAEFLKDSNLNYIKNPLFSNLNLDSTGNVMFDFSGTIDPSTISYRSYLNSITTQQ